jgi:hypothetical protein
MFWDIYFALVVVVKPSLPRGPIERPTNLNLTWLCACFSLGNRTKLKNVRSDRLQVVPVCGRGFIGGHGGPGRGLEHVLNSIMRRATNPAKGNNHLAHPPRCCERNPDRGRIVAKKAKPTEAGRAHSPRAAHSTEYSTGHVYCTYKHGTRMICPVNTRCRTDCAVNSPESWASSDALPLVDNLQSQMGDSDRRPFIEQDGKI